MRKIIATLINEFRLFRKDLAGVALLFLMPLVLTIIMALIQDAPFREYQDIRFDVLWVNKDNGRLAEKMKDGLMSIPQFRLVSSYENKPLDEIKARELVQSGTFKIAIIVPEGITAEVVNSANQVANDMGKRLGAAGKLPERETRSANLEIYFDPVTKQAMKLSLLNALDKQLTKVQAEMIMGRLSDRMNSAGGDSSPSPEFDLQQKMQAVSIKEFSADRQSKVNLNTNSVQHNVPAWAIFGLFFIIIPIAGNTIREREEGSLMRIRLIPGSYFSILFGRLSFYVLLGVAQFYGMLLAGWAILPKLGLPHLYMGQAPLTLLVTAMVIAITATAYGVCIGALFQTPNQALPFGAISIVILSAIGGIWVPVEILPAGLQQLAKVSPLHWALDAINTIFLRNGGLPAVWTNLAILLGFSAVFVTIAGLVESGRQQ
ncbi:ABC transporter permease [Flavihumibacter profundi]|uniref:ABC transporter permease n=1 Tax=Flavihumibacter profundi TaxID=2716883 RepID=UPI001CC652DE|nr:ABC transporter permease [Flavihumibacter profundi]MBZ5859129.1 ABC transporter permease [Flavihumibacter profundi]